MSSRTAKGRSGTHTQNFAENTFASGCSTEWTPRHKSEGDGLFLICAAAPFLRNDRAGVVLSSHRSGVDRVDCRGDGAVELVVALLCRKPFAERAREACNHAGVLRQNGVRLVAFVAT